MTKLEKYILEKMIRKRVIGSKHIQYNNILKSIRSDEIGDLKTVVKNLLKKGYLVWYDRSRKAIQLNKYKLKEIKELLLNM